MSRCFPFPPPGYENKPIAENLDLLTKEKRKEKRKKDKKDKEKRERKEKKEKDRSKDKQKEKKDRKEKHKDRKKDKDIDKGKSSEDRRAEDRNEGTHNRESLQKAEEIKDSKLAEELGERIRDDGTDNRLVTTSIHRKIEHRTVAHPSLEKDIRAADKKVFPAPIGSSQRNDGNGNNLPVENSKNSPHGRIGNISAATSIDLERSKLSTVGFKTDQNRNHGMSRSIEAIPGLVKPTAGMEKEKFTERNVVSNSIAPAIDNKGKLGTKVMASNSARKNDFSGFPAESISSIRPKTETLGNSFIQSRMDGMGGGAVPAIEKERVKGSGMLSVPVSSSDQRRNNTLFQPMQKDRNQKVDKKDEVGKGLNHKEHDTKKIIKPKDTNKHTKEEEEKIVEKASAAIENNKIRNFVKKDQIDTLNSKPLAPHRNNSPSIIKGVDETSNKRTNLKINGFILENDARPNKMPRLLASSSHQPLAAPPSIPDRTLDHKEREINGSAKSPDGRNGEISLKLKSPHPDSKYLEQIYTVPKMEQPWLENGDLEWLSNRRRDSSQKKPASDKESLSQVWSDALWIESADVLALPYVVPF